MHSEVLFAGDDGLPLQFNIQSTVEKNLKVIIEHGGGICTLCDDAIYLISPGTKVVNVPSNKQLISTRYIFDSVKEDCLLDFEDYQVQIHEMNISDFSESSASNLPENQVNFNDCATLGNVMKDGSISPPNLLNCSKSNHAFDFLDSQNHNNATGFNTNNEPRNSHVIFPLQTAETDVQHGLPDNQADQGFDDIANEGSDGSVSSPDLIKCSNKSVLEFEDNKAHNDVPSFSKKNEQGCSHVVIPLQTAETHIQFSSLLKQKINPKTCINAIPDSLEDGEQAINVRDNSPAEERLNIEANPTDPVFMDDEPAFAVVSSSQENEGALDQFDKMILNKVLEKPALEVHFINSLTAYYSFSKCIVYLIC